MKEMVDMVERRVLIQRIVRALADKTQTPWGGSANSPFYAILDKPSPSLSKHDTPTSPHWAIPDVEFVLLCANGGVAALLKEIEYLKAELEKK